MASIVLLHSAVGVRPALLVEAQRWRTQGHTVTVPDLYEGAVFDDVDAGMAFKASVGGEELTARAAALTAHLPAGQVWAGWSLGAAFAQELLEERGGAGALLCGYDGWVSGQWPAGVPCQLHAAQDDPWVGEDDLAAFAAATQAQVHRYAGGHLFADDGLPDFDAASAAAYRERADAFLAGL